MFSFFFIHISDLAPLNLIFERRLQQQHPHIYEASEDNKSSFTYNLILQTEYQQSRKTLTNKEEKIRNRRKQEKNKIKENDLKRKEEEKQTNIEGKKNFFSFP